MLPIKVKKRVKEHKWDKHSNPSIFFSRIEKQVDAAIKDMVLLADNLDEKRLKKIFTDEKLESFVKAIMSPDTSKQKRDIDYERIFFLGSMFLKLSLNITGAKIGNKWAKQMYQKHELPLKEIIESICYERKRQIKKK